METKKTLSTFWQSVALGALSGSRATFGPMAASHILSTSFSETLKQSNFGFMQSPKTARAFKVMASGEVIGDKMPFVMDRIKPGSVTGRMASGAIAGGSIYEAAGENSVIGLITGAVAALAATFATFYVRNAIVKSTKIIDPFAGAAEDAIMIVAAMCLINKAIRPPKPNDQLAG
jgi:uncharacterized membrane protein